MNERVLPHSLDAERAVLGSIFTDNTRLYEVGAQLRPQDFYRVAHQHIFAALVSLSERGIGADFITVKNELAKRGELEACGGPAYIAGLPDGVPKTTNIEFYGRIVRETSVMRGLITAATKVIDAAYEATDDPGQVLGDAERSLLLLSEQSQVGDLLLLDQIAPATMALLESISHSGRSVTGLATGFRELDDATRGLHPSNLIVLGGRPGEGKSALALQIAIQAAQSVPVAFFSMEMNRDELFTRGLAQVAKINHHAMMQGWLSEADQRKVGTAFAELSMLPLAIDDQPALTPFQIRSKARTFQMRRGGLGLIVVDYLQLLQRPRHAHSREEAVADNTWALKMIAGELRVPVLALSQLNRSSQQRDDKRPTLSDLRESGAVEQHANVVLLIYRPPERTDGAVVTMPPVELLIAKQRNGPQGGKVDLVFRGESMRFEEATWNR